MRPVRAAAVTLGLVAALSAVLRLAQEPLPRLRTVVVDPGHGGDDVGVRGSSGTEEKQLTLDVARRLRSLLESQQSARVVLTREDDRRLSADERAAAANAAGGDLLLSLHANAAYSVAVTGAEVYYSSVDPSQRNLPPLDNAPLALVPWDEAQPRQADASARLAGVVREELQRTLPLTPRPIRQAPLRGLRGANMPAVLVEMLFLTNPDQEQAAGMSELKDAIAAALAQAVMRFDAAAPASQP